MYEKLGDALTQQQQLLTALTAYQKVIEQASENDSIYFRIGKVYHQLKQWEQAVSYYQKAIDLLQNRKKPHPNPPRRFGEGAEKPGISPPNPPIPPTPLTKGGWGDGGVRGG